MVKGKELDPAGTRRRQRILRTTIALVATRGADNVRLRDVADAAGVSIGTLQHYFTTRDALLQEAFRHHSDSVIADIAATVSALEGSPWERADALFLSIRDSPRLEQRSIVLLEWAAASTRDPLLRKLIADVYAEWRVPLQQAVEDGTARGVMRPRMPLDDLVPTVLALIDGFEMALAINVEGTDRLTIYRRLVMTTRVLLGMDDAGADPPSSPGALEGGPRD
jgi:AcrR family transcriptional regulator